MTYVNLQLRTQDSMTIYDHLQQDSMIYDLCVHAERGE